MIKATIAVINSSSFDDCTTKNKKIIPITIIIVKHFNAQLNFFDVSNFIQKSG